MFKGLSAFPLTPLSGGEIEEKSFTSLIENLVDAGVDSIGALGSTGSYAYLTRKQRYLATKLAVSAAADIPVITSIGHVRAEEVLLLAEDAQKAGVSGVLLAPVSYQKLSADEVFNFYQRITSELSVPLCIYDNAATTGFEFTDELLVSLSSLPRVGSIKLGDFPADCNAASRRVENLKKRVSEGVTIGISGDTQSAAGMMAGCSVWYSVLGGVFPRYSKRLAQAALSGDINETHHLNEALEPLWTFYRHYGSLRVIASVAEILGVVPSPCLPFPLQSLTGEKRASLENILNHLNFLN
ncbi:dihydrodipicolinate synthase family protein [Citrobacter rodentium]|uniref:Dihydrodipicolinate synthase family protein n=2 Tax=Citrobacter rodentium TaxID=67825 RepID=D2TU27_CITRI|nr:dihydrodipicolinate synthase family protein [Citrobacter rodentium]KIQ53139.1 dihydrodipicolinate synthase [Citrobacter rodentium]QBY29012.1 dihydrodipicolinate synthase family protein [Citrobacter rodentium]UHO29131.1 dihydrodipicolinate synthase family protein [Citrobacter rodentium NBRC 105723 = DSM 16636]CBG89259.1 conserved hypothetical protein [Citrobacter rodentium ICC168]HAT8014735.1 dihydrodipicolinate synthase family protein [Citrobacter rodentium NBRC 105723 = DSM 16636]